MGFQMRRPLPRLRRAASGVDDVPEGDTIFRAARTLNRALAGHEVVRFESVLSGADARSTKTRRSPDGTIESVTAAGKHVLMRFSSTGAAHAVEGGLVLRTHMRMNGSWHIYRPGETWQRPRRDMRVVVATTAFEAVGFNVPVAEFLQAARARAAGRPAADGARPARRHVRRRRSRSAGSASGRRSTIADALLNQRIVAGAGNVYKSEVLFLCGVNPFAPRRTACSDETLRAILVDGAETPAGERRSIRAAAIATYRGYRRGPRDAPIASERRYVYGRARKPCRTCGTPIRVQAQGPHARLTYWCPRCQVNPVTP